MSAARVLRMVRHEMQMVVTNPRLLLAIVGLPLALALVVNVTFNPAPTAQDRLAIQDLDSSALSKKVASQLRAWKGLTTLTVDAAADPTAYVTAHPDVVVVQLPQGLDQSVLQGEAIPLATFVNRSTQRSDATATSAVSNAGVEISGVATAVAAARARALRNKQDENAAARTAENDALAHFQLGRTRNQMTFVGAAAPAPLGRQAQFATVTGMSLLELVALLLAFSMASESENARLRRLLWSRLSLPEVLLARVLVAWVWLLVAMVVILGVSAAFGMPQTLTPTVAGVTLLVTLAVSGYAVLIMGVGYAARQIFQTVGAILTIGVGAVGGSLLGGALPGGLASIGRLTPNSWGSDAYRAVLTGQPLSTVEQPLLVLLVMAAIQVGLGYLLVRRALRVS